MFHIRRLTVRIVHILPYLALGAAVALFATSIILDHTVRSALLSDYATVVGILGAFALIQRYQTRLLLAGQDQIMAKIADLDDKIILMGAAGAADAIRAHLGPDSVWRQNLIKETADLLNDDNEITVAAVEGTLRDIVKRLDALERNYRHQGN